MCAREDSNFSHTPMVSKTNACHRIYGASSFRHSWCSRSPQPKTLILPPSGTRRQNMRCLSAGHAAMCCSRDDDDGGCRRDKPFFGGILAGFLFPLSAPPKAVKCSSSHIRARPWLALFFSSTIYLTKQRWLNMLIRDSLFLSSWWKSVT